MHEIISSPSKTISFLQKNGVLLSKINCRKCRKPMKMSTKKNSDGYTWKCQSRKCNFHTESVRKNSKLSNIKASLSTILEVLYNFNDEISFKSIMKKCGVGIKLINSIIDSFSSTFKKICSRKIGGKGKTVEIDETVLSKRKYNTGRSFESLWCIGGICRETKEVFYTISRRRNADLITSTILKHVDIETRVITDEWRGYRKLTSVGFDHHTICHKKHKVDPNNPDINTQNIEVYWRYMKKYIKRGSPNNKKRLFQLINSHIFLRSIKNDFSKLLLGIQCLRRFNKLI